MGQTDWDSIVGINSDAAPALAGHSDNTLYAAAVTPSGDVRVVQLKTLGAGWEPPVTVPTIYNGAPFTADPATSPTLLLHQPDGRLYLFCRGTDDNLYFCSCHPGGTWNAWRRSIGDASATGRFSVTMTTPWTTHVIYETSGNAVRYLRHDGSGVIQGSTIWSDTKTGEIASNGHGKLFAALRTTADKLRLLRKDAPWDADWLPVVTEHGTGPEQVCLGLSNVARLGDSFHVAYVSSTLRDDVSGSLMFYVAHTRVRDALLDDRFFRNMYDYVPAGTRHPHVTLAQYRNRLVAAIEDEQLGTRFAWFDNQDLSGGWVELGVVANGQSDARIALAEVDFFDAQKGDSSKLASANFGNDLFAAAHAPGSNTSVFINFSRAFYITLFDELGHKADWCRNYTGTSNMEHSCAATARTLPLHELPVFSECGYGAMEMPWRLMHETFHLVMDDRKTPDDPYMLWIHPAEWSRAWIGPNINVGTGAPHDKWYHEAWHRVLDNVNLLAHGQVQQNLNLMPDEFPDYVVKEADDIFGEHIDRKQKKGDPVSCQNGSIGLRCRGFLNVGSENYDVTSRPHSCIGAIRHYQLVGPEFRDKMYQDRRDGFDLLWQKYCWVREHVFQGVEFGEGLIPIHPVEIVNVNSGKALDVTYWKLTDNAAVQQYTRHGGDNQRWMLAPSNDGYYQLVAMHSGKALDVTGVSTEDGARVQQYSRSSGHNQQWRVIPLTGGQFELEARHSGKVLEVQSWATTDGGLVGQYERHDGANQRWFLYG